MSNLKNKIKLAAMNNENHEDHLRKIQARNTNSPRIQEDYFTQLPDENEGRLTKKVSQEFSMTESCILGCICQFD